MHDKTCQLHKVIHIFGKSGAAYVWLSGIMVINYLLSIKKREKNVDKNKNDEYNDSYKSITL